MSAIPEIAMYYPHIHIRDDNWLKVAALYWPRLARLAPEGYSRFDSEVAKTLAGELGFLLAIEPPANKVADVATEYLDFVAANYRELKKRYAYVMKFDYAPLQYEARMDITDAMRCWGVHQTTDQYDKMKEILRSRVIDYDLDRLFQEDLWLLLHPTLSVGYTTTLIDRIAQANQLAVVTDEPSLHELHGCSVGEEFPNTFLGEPSGTESGQMRTVDDIAALYAEFAVSAVIPKNIESVPIKKVIKARTTLAAEFDTFREHLNTLTEEFSELAQVENLTVLQARLQMLVDRDLRRPTAALERSLRQLGLEPVSAVLGLKTLELPSLAAAATSVAGVPVVAGHAGLATARLIAATAGARSKRREVRQSSPVGYLLGLKQQIGRRGWIERIRQPHS